ncbi:polysaccharide biosynthesis C-terminal domain-containing protein [Microvirga sp. STR05]|uniref:Polysaccharide biosynthesis C-terminal domain-containing protein n=1 Tax=Hymenobacter duratus TaxID=2771356 RepID=A0ABR8JEL4_9BACT|nr:polysaccharide biosynthesis C-terminal domain-containing protein [Hymenobacter duratus]MBD2714230.1 polysaccharide biosynthesis C-terminal domain-containing protein [Hymenobacter duratus]MBR7949132.1 polysaccharide biosynthesis C-terminal domain-containing protein [Microvirga sp. STR05]
MLRRIFHTFATRLSVALLSFAVVWLTARSLGAAGRGAVSLFVTDCAALLLFIGLLGGSSLIFLVPRRNVWHLLVPAYGWALVVCTAGTVLAGLLRPVPVSYLGHLWALALLQAFLSINISLLLGRKQEAAYNALNMAQVALLAGFLLLAFMGLGWREVPVYYYAAYVAYGAPLLASFGLLRRLPDRWEGGQGLRATAAELSHHSRGAHLSNILAFANYRLSYYFVAHFVDTRAVGVLSVGVALAEAIWLIPRSAALIQYVDLVHADDKHAQLAPTLRVARLAALATAAAIAVLALLPTALLAAVFGPEFGAARPVIGWLAPGVVAVALNVTCSSYFAGLGQYRINNWATTMGLLVTVPACWLLIPKLGIVGAAMASSLSYVAATTYLLLQFGRATGTGWSDWLPNRTDVAYARELVKNR